MKIAIITDQHFGARKNSKLFHDFFQKFYDEVFFPYLDDNNISVCIDMGDTFDNRTGINYSALRWAKDNYFQLLCDRGIDLTCVVGNHTAYYKNTNKVNACELLLREYDNIHIVSEYEELNIGGLDIAFIPWINSENEESTYKKISKSKCPVAMGHLELKGFAANLHCIMEHGADKNVYKNFKKVLSGHYHTRSVEGNINYLGNPYEIYWNDYGDTRGFHVFDTETLEYTAINNPYNIFYKIYYEDTNYQTFDTREYENKIVKLIVRKKSDQKKFEKFIDKLFSSNVADLKIIESVDFSGWYSKDKFEATESEDTLSILTRYIDESETDIDSQSIKNVVQEVYKEACEVVE